MRDLLPSLAGTPPQVSEAGDVESGLPLNGGSTEATLTPPQPQRKKGKASHLEEFFQQVADIKTLLESIKHEQDDLKQLHERSKSSTRTKEANKFSADMTEVVDRVNRTATKVKQQLELLDAKNEEARKTPGNEASSSNDRMRTAVTAGLKKKLKDMMAEFGALRRRIQDENREMVGRRLYTVTGKKAAEEDVDRLIETGQSDKIFQKAMLMEQGKGHILDTLAEIQERHEAVKHLEKSLYELHQIFLDMAVLVEAQGEQLDSIEAQVGKSMEYVVKGTEQLVQARELQKDSRKW
eukprot:CAMPEP_0177606588 /NCGR_PEP_ID=MMETSP0419_2-20121207/17390_1 /TAXON_ID=582737 /ORGANISM="Tetraselmis sp., Strain GSL018" /LENGTH=294 /DNA_ID=CAMNT_0019100965 /DNA_START=216 /DNA_END=1097 /DNA_ORIENTATION=-